MDLIVPLRESNDILDLLHASTITPLFNRLFPFRKYNTAVKVNCDRKDRVRRIPFHSTSIDQDRYPTLSDL